MTDCANSIRSFVQIYLFFRRKARLKAFFSPRFIKTPKKGFYLDFMQKR